MGNSATPGTPGRHGEREVVTVSELNKRVGGLLQQHLPTLWVEGEISNFVAARSGHWYFTLKDAHAQVRCAMFRGRNQQVGARPEDGTQVLVRARAGIYEARGDYQLIADHLEESGDGALRRAFEILKAKLQQEGLFDAAHKQPLPDWPACIGVVTSPTGAAIQDILTVLRRRFPAIRVSIYPVSVQGRAAAGEIVEAIRRANRERRCDVLIVGRGGGSLEDLWPFNEESVARAIHASELPVVSAVGHEVDFTIADFVADLRAPTPSAAAEMLSPDQDEIRAAFRAWAGALREAMLRRLDLLRRDLHLHRRSLRHPRQMLQERAQQLDHLEIRLLRSIHHDLGRHRAELLYFHNRLLMNGPHHRIGNSRIRVEHALGRLERAARLEVERYRNRLQGLAGSLNQISPLATLARGYALVSEEQTGKLVRRASEVEAGARVRARLGSGSLRCTVDEVNES